MRRIFLLPFFALALHGAEPVAIPPMKFTHRTLANGLEVYAAPDHATPTVAINVWYHVGSKDDPAGRSGFAHLFEHIMFKGTKHMKPEMIDRLTEDVGGFNNAYTADDVTVYYEVVPSNHLERLLWAEAERMATLNVDEKNFGSASTRCKYSCFTTSRSERKFPSSTLSVAMRSASAHSRRSRWFDGTTS